MDIKTRHRILKSIFVGNQILWVKVIYDFLKEINELQTKTTEQTGFIKTLINHVDNKSVLEDLKINEEFKRIIDGYKS